ncbi:MAG: sugar phosphate isomerase/epimerase [Planctomycetes bacterium]|nr:sugar phosphate isomerase/epimerase [Planctomycetota bacterium]
MKLAFTTLGCTGWDLDTIIARAVEYGYDGVDFRGYRGELKIYELPEFTADLEATVAKFDDAGLDVPCLSTSARVCADPAGAIEEVRRYAPLCEAFGATMMRVFGGPLGEMSREQAIDATADTLRAAGAIAADYGAAVLLETHDAWPDGRHLKAVMERAGSDAVGVLWDVMHPFNAVGETPAATTALLGRWIRYTHFKDARRGGDGKLHLCPIGEGDLPLADCVAQLRAIGYDGWLTLEWEKQWHADLDEPEAAYPQYVKVMRRLLGA